MYRLKGKVHHYAWGGTEFIPGMLGISNPENQPFAEYWLGSHPSTPAQVWLTENAFTTLQGIIRSDPRRYLGDRVYQEFGELPFLLKVLDVKDMLSIQVHPGKAEASLGFERENELKIPLDAPHRNYKDPNHKPEVMVALSDFWLLHGFLHPEGLKEVLERIPEFSILVPLFEAKGYKGLYQYVMELPQHSVDEILQPLMNRILPLYQEGRLSKMSPDFWAGRVMASRKLPDTHFDRGVFSIYFFNLVYLREGEGIFQGAGIPHAYLEGQNMELMSNSDNVLRGGLTTKHVDVPELLKHIHFEGVGPLILKGNLKGWERAYPCPVPEFILRRIDLPAGEVYTQMAGSAEICFVNKGIVEIAGETPLSLKKGESGVVFSGQQVVMKATEITQVFIASVP